MKHTPGPWRIDSGHEGGWMIIGCDLVLCQRSPWAIRQEESKANARLIAAAPDLLEAAENLENDDGAIPEHAWKLLQDAIAKAKGTPRENP